MWSCRGWAEIGAVTETDQPTPKTPLRRRRWPIYAAAGAVLALLLAGAAFLLRDQSFTVTGTITVIDSNGNGLTFGPGSGQCHGRGGYSDLTETTQVVITDAAGTVVATGAVDGFGTPAASAGRVSPDRCVLAFTVKDVPAGHDFYTIEVARRGKLTYPAEHYGKPLRLQIGSEK